MSIFGEWIAQPAGRGPNMAEVLSDYAKKDYVDEQLALRVLKTGDTMSGDLRMTGGLFAGCPGLNLWVRHYTAMRPSLLTM